MSNFFAEEEAMEGRMGDGMKKFLSFIPVYPAKPMKCIEISRLSGVRKHSHLLPILAPLYEEDDGRVGFVSLKARNDYFERVGIPIPQEA